MIMVDMHFMSMYSFPKMSSTNRNFLKTNENKTGAFLKYLIGSHG